MPGQDAAGLVRVFILAVFHYTFVIGPGYRQNHMCLFFISQEIPNFKSQIPNNNQIQNSNLQTV
jgi:hypothetical protein